uniref:Uncharacterized protein n=1 Tax=Anopheles albimanus TaxID=7167 RepID=A0A182FLH2_ANOAL
MLGSAIGAIDWSALPVGIDAASNETNVFLATWIVMLVCLVSTLTSFREIPLPVLEKGEMLRPVTYREVDNNLNRQQQEDYPSIPYEETEQLQCYQLMHSIIHMPLAMKKLYFTHLLSVMSHMNFYLFLTDFVATEVFHGNAKAPKESAELKLYEAGVRYGCLGMILFATFVALYSLVIKRLIERFGSRTMYLAAFMLHCLSMLTLGFVHHRAMVMISCGIGGILYSTINSIPYLLLSHYHSKNALLIALVVGIIIDAVGTCTVTLYIASGCAFLAIISATSITYLGL